MKRFFAFFLIFFLFFPVFSQKSWRLSLDGKTRIFTSEKDDFLWNGENAGLFANGSGTVSIYKNGKKTAFIRAVFVFGAEESDFVPLSDGSLYAGESKGSEKKLVPHGFGVLKKANGNVYAGVFRRGAFSGSGERFDSNGTLLYSGEFKNGRYNGNGKLFEDKKLVYSGIFKDGVRHGSGIETVASSTFCGKWKNDKKDGSFEIKTGSVTRIVFYKDGIADLQNAVVRYPNGIEWSGSVDSEMNPAGEGVLKYPSGDVYSGEVFENARNGFGHFVSADGFSYSGEWSDDVFEGSGEASFSFSDGTGWHYAGNWSGGEFDGFGELSSGHFSYSGEWKNGERLGNGTIFAAGAQYDGELKSDRLNGQGLFVFPNGDYYDGHWVESRQEGFGEYHWKDGSSYVGFWEDGLQNGEGELFFADGSSYSGDFVDGKLWGSGIFCYDSGERYEGEFEENKKNGVGSYFFQDGSVYEGEFREDKIDGRGRFLKKDGSFYEGEFKSGKIGGVGSLFVPDGESFVVLYSKKWTADSLPLEGTVSFSNGDEFVGKLQNGKPTEYGVWRKRGEKGFSESAYDFYKLHEREIESVADSAQIVLSVVSLAGDVVAMVPYPPVSGVSLAVSRVADFANAAISGLRILVGTGVLAYETGEANGDSQKIKELRKEYAKKQAWNVADIVFTAGSAAWKSFRMGKKAAKAAEKFPALKSAVSKTGKLSSAARSNKIGDKFVRGTVELAYGKVGKKLVSEYGDDAAHILFRYGDGAVEALTRNGGTALSLAKKNPVAFKAFLSSGKESFDLLEQFPKYSEEIALVLEKSGTRGVKEIQKMGKNAPAFLSLAKKHADFLEIAHKTSFENASTLVKIVEKDGGDALKTLKPFSKNGGELNRVLKHASLNDFSLLEIKSLGGKLPKEKLLGSIRKSRIDLTRLQTRLQKIRSKGKISLSKKEIEWVKKEPKVNLRALIRAKTGEKTLGGGFQEFFIRLSDGNKAQVSELLENPEIRKTVNHAIRGSGGVHEWLMTKNYLDFLTNEKWGKDGQLISLALTELVQDTRTVAFKNGGTHFDKVGSGKFHDGLGKAIDASANADELLKNVRAYAQKSLTAESFLEFEDIFVRCFGKIK